MATKLETLKSYTEKIKLFKSYLKSNKDESGELDDYSKKAYASNIESIKDVLIDLKIDIEKCVNNKIEYILCAAIHYKDGKIHKGMPKNINTGIVVCGRRHSDCYAILSAINGDKDPENVPLREGQGFITSNNRYVDRKEGYFIAKKAGQLLLDLGEKEEPCLISENLY